MPQMAPIWWTTLFTIFIMLYAMFMTMIYFFMIYENKTSSTKNSKKIENFNWKW